MKNLVKFLKDRRGVSPVIGVILMVAITVVLGAVVAAFAYGYIGTTTKAPNVVLSAIDDPTPGDTISLLLKDSGGEKIVSGDWECCIANGKDAAIVNANFTSAGIFAVDLTPGTSIDVTPVLTGWNHIVVRHIPSGSVLLDTNVLVR